MKKLFIANWKMNFDLEESLDFIKHLDISHLDDINSDIIIAPPLVFLFHLSSNFQKVQFASQDVSYYDGFGSFTGECSAKMIKSHNVNYSIIGHSDRRSLFSESKDIIIQKIDNCMNNEITPIICIGESLEARQNLLYKELISEQIRDLLPSLKKDVIIAYEPVWAIGTGETPKKEDISEALEIVNSVLDSNDLEISARLVYGGSVTRQNYKEILSIEGISGLLIGRASLNLEEFNSIINWK